MTSHKPIKFDRAQLLRDVVELGRFACELGAHGWVHNAEMLLRTAQVLRAVAEGEVRWRIPGNPHFFTSGKIAEDAFPVLIIPATISPDEGEGT